MQNQRKKGAMGNVRSKGKKKRDPLPEHFKSLEEAAEFWDAHDSSDYEDYMTDVECEFDLKKRIYLVEIDGKLYEKVEKIARKQHLSPETLVNRRIAEKA